MSMCGYYGEGCGGNIDNPMPGSQGWVASLTPKERAEYIKKSNSRWKGTIFDRTESPVCYSDGITKKCYRSPPQRRREEVIEPEGAELHRFLWKASWLLVAVYGIYTVNKYLNTK